MSKPLLPAIDCIMLVILILGKEIEGIKLNLIIAMTVVILSEFASRDVIEQASNFVYHFPFLFCVAQKKNHECQ